MENENNGFEQNVVQEQSNFEQNSNTKINVGGIVDFFKSHMKIIAIIAIAIVVILAVAYAVTHLIGSPEKAVKDYVSALNSGDANKIIKAMDIKGCVAYTNCSGGYFSGKDLDDFEDKYEKVKDKEVKDYKESIEDSYDKDAKKEMKKSKFSIKVLDIKDVEEVDEVDKMYEVTAKIKVSCKDDDGDEQTNSTEHTFYVYKNKVISTMSGFSFLD